MRIRNIIIAAGLLLIIGYVGYNYLYKDHRDIASETVDMTLTSSSLRAQFTLTESPNILNKTILVTGVVTSLENEVVVLDEIIHCSLIGTQDNLKLGQSIQIKGRCIGYDELFDIKSDSII